MIFLSSISTDTFNGLSALRLFKLRNERRVTSPGSKSGGRIRKGKEIKQKWRFDSRHATIRYTARNTRLFPVGIIRWNSASVWRDRSRIWPRNSREIRLSKTKLYTMILLFEPLTMDSTNYVTRYVDKNSTVIAKITL